MKAFTAIIIFVLFATSVSSQSTYGGSYSNNYLPVSMAYVDSILYSLYYPEMLKNRAGIKKVRDGNIRKATGQRISFNAIWTNTFGKYGSNLRLLDTQHKVAYDLDNDKIAGRNNEVSAIELIIKGHKYYLPITTCNWDKAREKMIWEMSLEHNPVKLHIYAYLITSIEGHAVLPTLLIDDFTPAGGK
jgi:hypothetical protein